MRLWPLLLRLAVGVYFVYPHITPFANGLVDLNMTIEKGIYSCVEMYIPIEIGFSLYHGFFVILGLLIIGLMRSVFPLVVGLFVVGLSLYIDFLKEGYSIGTMLLFVLMLVTISLILYTLNPRFNQ